MQVWTISRERYAKKAFTCEGLAYWRAMKMPISNRWDLNGSHPERPAAWRVPSAAVKGAWNVLLDPAHVDFAQVGQHASQPFHFDQRMYRIRNSST